MHIFISGNALFAPFLSLMRRYTAVVSNRLLRNSNWLIGGIGSIGRRFGFKSLHWTSDVPLSMPSLDCNNMQYVDLNAFDLIAAVFYSGILSLKMAFLIRVYLIANSKRISPEKSDSGK
jgi:hypothetical protein